MGEELAFASLQPAKRKSYLPEAVIMWCGDSFVLAHWHPAFCKWGESEWVLSQQHHLDCFSFLFFPPQLLVRAKPGSADSGFHSLTKPLHSVVVEEPQVWWPFSRCCCNQLGSQVLLSFLMDQVAFLFLDFGGVGCWWWPSKKRKVHICSAT